MVTNSRVFIKILDVIFTDELGQLSAELITLYNYILRQVRGITSFMGEIFMIGSLYHLQIQPIDGTPFIFAHSIIPCIKMVPFKHSVCVSVGEFVEFQSIVQTYYNEFDLDPESLQCFRCICSGIFTYDDSCYEK